MFRIAPSYNLQLEAVVVVGSYGPLSAYDVIAVIAEPNCTRVSFIPLSRIVVAGGSTSYATKEARFA